MGSKYWIKLYHEILDDPKMGRLDDRLYRRTIEVFLLAGDYDQDGLLPALSDMAWRLRMREEDLETDLIELQRVSIVHNKDGRWIVTKFAERQAPVPVAERVARHRERKRQDEYYGTPEKQGGNVGETKRYTDTDTDTEREARIREEEALPLPQTVMEAEKHPVLKMLYEATEVFPGTRDYKTAIDAVNFIRRKFETDQESIDHIKKFWLAWSSRKTIGGKPYKKTNITWLTEWAINDDIPPVSSREPESVQEKMEREGYEYHRRAD